MSLSRLTATVCCIFIATVAISQTKQPKIKFGDIKPDDFKPEFYALDSSADAVYLYDEGSANERGNNKGWFSVVYKVHERIRLLHKKSFDDAGTVKIALIKHEDDIDKLEDLQAATYNIEDGKVIAINVDKNSVFKDKDGADQVVKFTFPNLKEGCIIEYSYTKTIPAFSVIPSWSFQNAYPTLWSQYTLGSAAVF